MAGGADSYGEVAAGLALAARHRDAPCVDAIVPAREGCPGELEATRGHSPRALVAGVHADDGWRVWLSATMPLPIALTTGEARELVRELTQMIDVCEGRWT